MKTPRARAEQLLSGYRQHIAARPWDELLEDAVDAFAEADREARADTREAVLAREKLTAASLDELEKRADGYGAMCAEAEAARDEANRRMRTILDLAEARLRNRWPTGTGRPLDPMVEHDLREILRLSGGQP